MNTTKVWKHLDEKPELHIQVSAVPTHSPPVSVNEDTLSPSIGTFVPTETTGTTNETVMDSPSSDPSPKVHAPSYSASSGSSSMNTGLWNHSGLSKPQPKYKIIIAIILVLLGYGFAMLANGAASRFLTPRWLLLTSGSQITSNPLYGVGLAVSAADPVFLLSSFRVIATIFLLISMYLCNDVPTGFKEGIIQFPSFKQALVPIFIGATNALGYMPYMVLTACDGVALWAALVGLYVIIPVTYGIVIRKESRNKRKLIGISACIIAGILLGLPDPDKSTDDSTNATGNISEELAPVWIKFFLFIGCIGLWGACDGMVGFVGRDIHQFWVALYSAVGFTIAAFVSSWVSFIATAMDGPSVLLSSSSLYSLPPKIILNNQTNYPSLPMTYDILGPGGIVGYFVLFGAQILGIIAWYSSVRLGQMSEASAFLPITSLYTLLTSIGGVVILHETLPVAGYLGIVLGAIGMIVIALS